MARGELLIGVLANIRVLASTSHHTRGFLIPAAVCADSYGWGLAGLDNSGQVGRSFLVGTLWSISGMEMSSG